MTDERGGFSPASFAFSDATFSNPDPEPQSRNMAYDSAHEGQGLWPDCLVPGIYPLSGRN